jgi:hypothetical protein
MGRQSVSPLTGGAVSVFFSLLRDRTTSKNYIQPKLRNPRACFRTLVSRSLRLETLETRYALSSLTTMDPSACLPVEDEQLAVATAISDSTEAPAESEAAEFVGPLEADAYFQSLSETEPASTVQEGEDTEETTKTSPTIWTFGVSYDGNYWIVAGELTDDNVLECRVNLTFDGVLQTPALEVMPDGSFIQYLTQHPGSVVSADAIDGDGNTSNTMTAIV